MKVNCKQIKADYEALMKRAADFGALVEKIRTEPYEREKVRAARREQKNLAAAHAAMREKMYYTEAMAREFLGKKNVRGPEEIEKCFGFKVKNIPPIKFKRADFEKAKKYNERLVLYISHDNEGKVLTMERILEIMAGRLNEKEGKLLYSQNKQGKPELTSNTWYKEEDFFKKEGMKMEWRFVSNEFVAGSKGKDYIEQTRLIRDKMKEMGALTKEEDVGCSDKELEELRKLLERDRNANWKSVAQRLSEMLVNKNHRRSAVQILYDWVLGFKNGGGRSILKDLYEWSNSRSSGGGLFFVGYADASGVSVDRWDPAGHLAYLGVCSAR